MKKQVKSKRYFGKITGSEITDELRQQILTIRDTGRTNMLDIHTVQRIAHEMQFYKLVIYIFEHSKEYAHFIITGETNTKTD